MQAVFVTGIKLIVNRVKLPKSFLAINLSESHTFHRKESQDETSSEESKNAPTTAPAVDEKKDSESAEPLGNDPPVIEADDVTPVPSQTV